MALQSRQLYAKERRRSILGLPARLLSCWFGLLVGQQLLRGLFHLLEQPSMIARLIDCILQLLALLREALEPLLICEILTQRILHHHEFFRLRHW